MKENHLKVQLKTLIEQRKLTLQSMSSNLKAVSPLAVLDRGYAIVMNNKGKAIKSSKEVKIGDIINTRLAEGELISNVSKKINLLNLFLFVSFKPSNFCSRFN